MEFSISRQALLDAGWDGKNASDLLYQVYTTKDGTSDNPVGAGNIGGRSDIRDCIYNDYIASDYYADQAAISGTNAILYNWCGLKAGNDRGKKVKVVSLVHGNQAIQPGSVTQDLINNNARRGLLPCARRASGLRRASDHAHHAHARFGDSMGGGRPLGKRGLPRRPKPERAHHHPRQRWRHRPARQHVLRSYPALLRHGLEQGQRCARQ